MSGTPPWRAPLVPFRLSGRLLVDAAGGDLGQKPVGLDLFLQRLVEEPRGVIEAELLRPGLERAVAGHLVVLNRLSRRGETGVERLGALEILHDLFGFLNDADDRFAGLAARRPPRLLEHLVQ